MVWRDIETDGDDAEKKKGVEQIRDQFHSTRAEDKRNLQNRGSSSDGTALGLFSASVHGSSDLHHLRSRYIFERSMTVQSA